MAPRCRAIGSLVSATPLHVGVLGTTNHLGSLGASVSVGALGPGIQAFRVVSQACVVTLSGEVRIAEPVATTLLDSAF